VKEILATNALSEYMSGAVERVVSQALGFSGDNAAERAFLEDFYGAQAEAERKRRRAGIPVPTFLIASIATRCNLRCKGCYARANALCGDEQAPDALTAERWDGIFTEAAALGVPFLLLAGGEPLTRFDVLEKAAAHRDILFPVFTNGTMFGPVYRDFFRAHRNLVPVFSLEGGEEATERRRGKGVYIKLAEAMGAMGKDGVLYGASITVTTENLQNVTDEAFLGALCEKGCKLVLYVEYVLVDEGTEGLAPTGAERALLAEREALLREKYPDMLFLAFPGDEPRLGGCLAAGRGFFHINANGNAEPCPFSPFSDRSLKDGTLYEALGSPLFRALAEGGLLQSAHDGGCVLFGQREAVEKLCAEGAKSTASDSRPAYAGHSAATECRAFIPPSGGPPNGS